MDSNKYVSIRKTDKVNEEEVQNELYINGESISSKVKGYKQLTVGGDRGLIPYSVEAVKFKNRYGSKPMYKSVAERVFNIKYVLEAKDSRDLRIKYNKMTDMLRGIMKISFKDDDGYFYKDVIITDASNDEETSSTIIGTFTLTAYDPFKYSGEIKEGRMVETESEYVEMEEMVIDFTETVEDPTIRVKNLVNRYVLEFTVNGKFKRGDTVIIQQKQDGYISVEGGSIELGTLSNTIMLYDGSEGEVGDYREGKVLFKWRERRL